MESSEKSTDLNLVLNDFRQSIDYIDTSFIFIIAERIRLIAKSIYFKQQQQLPLHYSERRTQTLQKTITLAVENGLNETFVRKLFNYMYQHASLFQPQESDKIFKTLMEINFNHSIMKDIQDSIYHLDVALCCLLAERYHLVKKIGKLKKILQYPPLSTQRWQKILTNKLTMATALNIDTQFMKDIMEMIHEESLAIENNIISNSSR